MRLLILLTIGLLAMAGPAAAKILFKETFDAGRAPFAFDRQFAAPGKFAVGGMQRQRVWMVPLQGRAGPFGFVVEREADWALGETLHWSGYVRFGYRDGQPEWEMPKGLPYDLRLPVITDARGQQVMGRFTRFDELGALGSFEVLTPDGRVHRVMAQGVTPLVSNRWYAIEIGLEDRGAHDRLRVWINNRDEANPDYQHVGGDFVQAADWRRDLRFRFGQRVAVPEGGLFYFDDVTIANAFIGPRIPDMIAPAPPQRLRVQ